MCVLCSKVLQGLLVAAVVHVVSVDLLDDVAWLEASSRRLPACDNKPRQYRVLQCPYSGGTVAENGRSVRPKSHGA